MYSQACWSHLVKEKFTVNKFGGCGRVDRRESWLTAASVGDTEGLVKVQVAHVSTDVSRGGEANLQAKTLISQYCWKACATPQQTRHILSFIYVNLWTHVFAYLSVHVSTVHVDEAAGSVHHLANLLDGLLENTCTQTRPSVRPIQ